MAELKLEVGKRYMTRGGWVTPPIEEDPDQREDSTFRYFAGTYSWRSDGREFHGSMEEDDLVSEAFVGSPEFELEGVPQGFVPVAFRVPKIGEYYLSLYGGAVERTHLGDDIERTIGGVQCLILRRA